LRQEFRCGPAPFVVDVEKGDAGSARGEQVSTARPSPETLAGNDGI
jgi:hypothetical protein